MDYSYPPAAVNVEVTKPSKLLWVILGILLVAFGIGVWITNQAFKVRSTTYEAVFLANNQTYYGELLVNGDTLVLNKVYTVQTVQQGSTTQPSLIYAGDKITFMKNQVIAYEDLASTSPIIKALQSNK
jgi:hypothetical protein